MVSLSLEIVTKQNTLLPETIVQRATATAEFGEIGIEPGHSPLIAKLKPGVLEYTDVNGEKHDFYIHGGIVEVQPNKITVLADSGLRTAELDAKAIAKAEAEARAKSQDTTSTPVERSVALSQLSEIAAMKQLLKRRGL